MRITKQALQKSIFHHMRITKQAYIQKIKMFNIQIIKKKLILRPLYLSASGYQAGKYNVKNHFSKCYLLKIVN